MNSCSSFIFKYIHKIFTSRRCIHWSISIQRPVSSTHVRDRTENTCKACTVCVKMTRLANIANERHKEVKRSLNWCHRMAKCWHSSACNSQIVQDIRPQSGRQFAQYTDKQQQNVKDIHNGSCPQSQWCHTSSSTIWNLCPTSGDKIWNVLHSLLLGVG